MGDFQYLFIGERDLKEIVNAIFHASYTKFYILMETDMRDFHKMLLVNSNFQPH
jgi:hypothetical protein